MKKITLVIAMFTMAMAASAQNAGQKFFDNWSIGAEGGVSTNLHDWDTPNGAVAGINLTKGITPVLSLEFQLQAGFNDNANWNMGRSCNVFDNASIFGNTKINLMNWFGGYKGTRRLFEIQARCGFGYLRYFYPDDITVTTAFCAPFMNSLNNLSLGRYMQEESGTPEERSQMIALMGRLLQNGEQGLYVRLLQLLQANHLNTDLTFTGYVNGCLGYFFSFFSYKTPATRQLPALDMPDDQFLTTIFEEVFDNEDQSYIYPYYIQCAKELGQYICDYDAYASQLEGTAFDINEVLKNPCELKNEDCWLYQTYDSTLLTDIRTRFIPTTNCPLLFVYSKDDPWTAARPDLINEQYSKMIINPIGVHNHDINSTEHYTPEMKQEIMDFIARYVPYGNDPVVAKRAPYSYFHEMKDKFMFHR